MSSTPGQTTMRAWVRRRRGTPSTALELDNSFPKASSPNPSSGDILIRVSHTALQFSSEFMLKTLPLMPYGLPSVPELEFTGTVVAAGSAASSDVREVGTRVVAHFNIPDIIFSSQGALAEYVLLPSKQAAPLPEGADMAAMAGVLGSGSTALKMVRTGAVQEGHRVLVNGASGSVGQLLVQLCKMRGARVTGVASGANEELVKALGVDEFIDYRKHSSLPAYLATRYSREPFDIVLDCVGLQTLYTNSPQYLKVEGVVINVGAMEGPGVTLKNWLFNAWWPTWLGGVPRRYVMFSTPPTKDDAIVLVKLVEEAKLNITVDSVFVMEEAIRAYERVATKRARGRVIVKIASD